MGFSTAAPRLGSSERGFASDRRALLIEIAIAIEIGSIGGTFHNDPDFDFDLDWARLCCTAKT
jgi:hypothetical protein